MGEFVFDNKETHARERMASTKYVES